MNKYVNIFQLPPQTYGDGSPKRPPRLINSWRLHFERHGWFEIGLHPEAKDDDGAHFRVTAILAIGKTHITMKEDELANFFMYLRGQEKFSKVGTPEKYWDDVKDNFYGAFWMENMRDGRYIIYFSDDEGEFHNVGPLYESDLKLVLETEGDINDQILELKMMKKELLYDLETFARECDGDAKKIRVLQARNPTFRLEMSTNHFSFFEEFIRSL